MKVLMISTDRNLFIKGSDACLRMESYGKLVDELSVILFTTRSHGLPTGSEKIGKGTVILYPTHSINRWLYIYNAIRIGSRISDVDIVTTQDPFETGLAGLYLAKKYKAKLQVQLHVDYLNPHFRTGLLNRIRVSIASFVIPRANCIRAVSERISQSLTRHFHLRHKPIVLPIFVDVAKLKAVNITEDLRKKYPQFKKIILMSSRLEPEKNISLGITAMKSVVEAHPNAGLVIVGTGSKQSSLEASVRELKLQNNVVFEGWRSDLSSYYKTSDLFLVTSDYEGYGRTIVEALASGCPVVSTDVGIARQAGADVADRKAIAAHIITHLSSNVRGKLTAYPYRNKEEYLANLKDSWSQCS